MSVLITGASGLIGRHLVGLLEGETDVVALSRTPLPSASATWIAADLSAPHFINALPSRVDTVVHLAQSPHYREFPEQAADVFNVNVASTALLLDWARRVGVQRFVQASAGGADRSQGTALSYYLAGKRSAELLAQSYANQFAVTVLRFFFVYGPHQRRSMLIPRLVDTVRGGQPITLAGNDGIRLNPVHVDDAVAAIRQAVIADRPGAFEIAGPDVMTMRQIGEAIASRLERSAQFTVADRIESDLVGDISEMTTRLTAPTRRFLSGVEDAF